MSEVQKYQKPSELLKTVEQVKIWLLEGQPMVNILEALYEKGESAKTIPVILDKAREEWAELAKADQDQIQGFVRAGYLHLYKKMIEIGDFANAMRALKELSKS